MCNILNRYFGSVFKDENSLEDPPHLDQLFQGHDLTDIALDTELVCTKLKQLKPDKAPGIDGLPTRLLIETADFISYPLCKIFENSLNTGCLPSEWKLSNVTPIYKGGKRSEPGNYRPVSLTPHACKVLESIIKDSMFLHLEEYAILNKSQHGFLSRRSCCTNLLTFFEKVSGWLDAGEVVDTIYLDFKKAFDTVPHNRLLSKIKACGVNGAVYNWISKWLIGRKQRVTLGGINQTGLM